MFVIDGGLASTLEQDGYKIDGDPLWSARLLATNPDAILKVHEDFLHSGADILITASYQASYEGFVKYLNLSEHQTRELIAKSVELARTAISNYQSKPADMCAPFDPKRNILIAGSVGPYGACQADGSEYHGGYMKQKDYKEIASWHRLRIETLINAGVDLLAIETFPALSECIAVIEFLKEFPHTKYWISFSCQDENYTNAKDNIIEAVEKCYKKGKDQLMAVGINCTPPNYIAPLLRCINQSKVPHSSILPRVVYPNSGEEWEAGKGWKSNKDKESVFISEVENWRDLGAHYIGGCCRTDPKAIKAIAQLLKK